MPSTPITTQFAIPPGVIDLGVGHPSLDLLPVELLRRAADHRFARADPSFLQYGVEQGSPTLRARLAEFLGASYVVALPFEEMLITNGISQALELVCAVFTRPGDTVLVEEPTYFLARKIFADHGLHTVSVPMDEQGILPAAAEQALRSHRPRLLYTIPTHQNPTGVTLSAVRRAALVELCKQTGTLLVADEVYHLLSYDAAPPPPLALSCASEQVIALGTFSKILAPGLRLGWLHAAPPLMERLVAHGMLGSGGGLNPFSGAIVESVFELALLQPWIEHLKQHYTRRRDALAQALHTHLGAAAHFALPTGGYFLWLALDPELAPDTRPLAGKALAHGVGLRAGALFGSQTPTNTLRLCFSYYREADLDEGVQRLARTLRLIP